MTDGTGQQQLPQVLEEPDYHERSIFLREHPTPVGLRRTDFLQNNSSVSETQDSEGVSRIEKQVSDILEGNAMGRYNERGSFESVDPKWIAQQFVTFGRSFFALEMERHKKNNYMGDARVGGVCRARVGSEYIPVEKTVLLTNYLGVAGRLANHSVSTHRT